MQVINVIDELPKHNSRRYGKRKTKDITGVSVHHSKTDAGTTQTFARFHVQNNNWPGIAYHYVIKKGGTIYKTQPNSTVSWHTGGHSSNNLGIMILGNYSRGEPPESQYEALISIIRAVMVAYGITIPRVKGHNEFSGHGANTCPGIDMKEFRGKLKRAPNGEDS